MKINLKQQIIHLHAYKSLIVSWSNRVNGKLWSLKGFYEKIFNFINIFVSSRSPLATWKKLFTNRLCGSTHTLILLWSCWHYCCLFNNNNLNLLYWIPKVSENTISAWNFPKKVNIISCKTELHLKIQVQISLTSPFI